MYYFHALVIQTGLSRDCQILVLATSYQKTLKKSSARGCSIPKLLNILQEETIRSPYENKSQVPSDAAKNVRTIRQKLIPSWTCRLSLSQVSNLPTLKRDKRQVQRDINCCNAVLYFIEKYSTALQQSSYSQD